MTGQQISINKAASSQPHTQSGNIFLYILGAIFLLGILVVMVKGSSTPGSNIDRETLEIKVAEVRAYGNELERGVAYILRNGYSESDIRFAHPNHSSAYGDITDIPARQVFAREGGGVTWRDNDPDIQVIDTDWLFNASNMINGNGTTSGADETTTELIAVLPYVSLEFCNLINQKNGITDSGTPPPMDCGNADIITPFSGSFAYSHQLWDNSGCGESELLTGKREGCFEGNANPPAGTYHYYRVLLAR